MNIQELPTEILLEISQYLDQKSYVRFMNSSSLLRSSLRNEYAMKLCMQYNEALRERRKRERCRKALKARDKLLELMSK